MGRQEKPLNNEPFADFANGLRELRRSAGLTYRAMAARTDFSASVLAEAASGRTLPNWRVAQAFVEVCGGDLRVWQRRFEAAQRSELLKGAVVVPEGFGVLDAPADPAAVMTSDDLVRELRRLRGTRTYDDLVRRSNRRLPRSTLSDMLSGKSVPHPHSLRLFLTACGLEAEQQQAWLDARERAISSPDVRHPFPAVRVRDADPRLLGVHASFQVAPTATDLPAYVPRDLDAELRAHLAAAAEHGGFVLLVGGSSAGKTRTLYEAVRAVMPDGWLVHPDPTEPPTLADLTTTPLAQTVVWLDELQRYLTAPGGLPAGRVRTLIAAGAVLVGTLWPDEYHSRIQPRPGRPESPDRGVLGLAQVISVPDQLSVAELARAAAVADHDARIREALSSPDTGTLQALAGGPELVRWWETASDPYGKAFITAALDLLDAGATAPVPRQLLEAAAPAYLTAEQQATAPDDWADRGLVYATTKLHGAVSALTPVPAGMGHIAGYMVADYLRQHARRVRDVSQAPDRVRRLAGGWDPASEHIVPSIRPITNVPSAHDAVSVVDSDLPWYTNDDRLTVLVSRIERALKLYDDLVNDTVAGRMPLVVTKNYDELINDLAAGRLDPKTSPGHSPVKPYLYIVSNHRFHGAADLTRRLWNMHEQPMVTSEPGRQDPWASLLPDSGRASRRST